MRGVNKVILVGTVGKDPEIRYMPNGKAVANLSIATSEVWKDQQGQKQEKTEWHRLTMYDKLAEIVGEYVKKGSSIYVEGKLETKKWQDQQGNDKYSTGVICQTMQMLGGKNEAQNGAGQGQNNNQSSGKLPPANYQQGRQSNQSQQSNQNSNGGMKEPDFEFSDDIPF